MNAGKSRDIPLKKLSGLTDRKFILRHNDDSGQREPVNHSHRDDYYMIGIVTEGSFTLSVDFKEIDISHGNAIIITPGQVHSNAGNHTGNGFVLALAPELLTDNDGIKIREYTLTQKKITLSANDFNDIMSLYELLKRRTGRYGSAEIALATAMKDMVLENITPGSVVHASRYIRIVTGLQSLMEKHIVDMKNPSEYASMLNVSGVYLNEAVKAVTGSNVSTFIGEYIVTLAKRQLYHTSLTVQEIASNLGFEDYCYFSRLFRRHAGISPKAFRGKYLE